MVENNHITIGTANYIINYITNKVTNQFNLWLTAPKGATPVNWISTTDWQIVRRDNVISITLRQL